MRKYWIHYYQSFGNTFALYYTESAEEEKHLPRNAERITRKGALKMARRESDSRKFDGAFSGFADAEIYPVNMPLQVGFLREFQALVEWMERDNTTAYQRLCGLLRTSAIWRKIRMGENESGGIANEVLPR